MDRYGYIGATRLSASAVTLLVKRHAARSAPAPEPNLPRWTVTRSRLDTSAAAAGVPERVIAEQAGHKGTAMLYRYPGGVFVPGERRQRGWAARRA